MTGQILPFPQTRTLTQVLAELMLAEGELQRLMARPGDYELSPIEDARWTELEGIIWLRRDEAWAIIESATGCERAVIERALT
jgi:hypothetical protein